MNSKIEVALIDRVKQIVFLHLRVEQSCVVLLGESFPSDSLSLVPPCSSRLQTTRFQTGIEKAQKEKAPRP